MARGRHQRADRSADHDADVEATCGAEAPQVDDQRWRFAELDAVGPIEE